MRMTKMIAAGLVALTVPLYAGASMAAPLSHPMLAGSAAKQDISVQHVQYRGDHGRWHQGRRDGSSAGFAAGVIVGGAASSYAYEGGYGSGYDAYAAAPGVAGSGPGWNQGWQANDRSGVGLSPQYSSCTGDRNNDSAFPSWACAH